MLANIGHHCVSLIELEIDISMQWLNQCDEGQNFLATVVYIAVELSRGNAAEKCAFIQ